MRNPILIIIIVVILAVAGVFFYSQTQNQVTDNNAIMKGNGPDAMMQKDDAMMDNDSTQLDSGAVSGDGLESNYVAYSKTNFEQAAKSRRILFFYANWCPTCRPTDADFEANSSKLPSDVTVIRVNYNDTETDQDERDLAEKYNITYQHTFLQLDSRGVVVTRWNGGGLNELLANIN